jgi:MFS family permease
MPQSAEPAALHPRAAAGSVWARWQVVILLMALCFVSHFNRISMAAAADAYIMDEYSIKPRMMGAVYSAFLLVYSICMIPGGIFIDRFGPRVALMVVGLGSALFSALTGVTGLVFAEAGQVLFSLILVRSVMGMLSAPLHPASARAVANWIPLERRSWANGLPGPCGSR